MEWISVKDRLPVEGAKVLIITDSRPMSKVDHEIFCALVQKKDGKIVFKDKWGLQELFKLEIYFWCHITHLPEGYELLETMECPAKD